MDQTIVKVYCDTHEDSQPHYFSLPTEKVPAFHAFIDGIASNDDDNDPDYRHAAEGSGPEIARWIAVNGGYEVTADIVVDARH